MRRLCAAFVLLAASACSSVGLGGKDEGTQTTDAAGTKGAPAGGSTASSPALSSASPFQGEGLVFSAISESALPAGACGMVLWTLDDEQPRPIMRYIIGKGAVVGLNGGPATLRIVDARGPSRYGVSERQTFASESGLTLTVEMRFGLGFEGGTYVERGLIAVEDPQGWRTVAPAAGLAGCRRA